MKIKRIEVIRLLGAFVLSAFLYALAVSLFIANSDNNVIPAGVSGIAMFISRVIFYDNAAKQNTLYSIGYIVLNIPLFFLAYKKIGKIFSIMTLLQVLATSGMIYLFGILFTSLKDNSFLVAIHSMEVITKTLFAGALAGASTGIALAANLSTGGSDIISLYFSVKKGVNVGKYILTFNTIVVVAYGTFNAIKVGNINALFYTLIYVFVSSFVVDFIFTRSKKVLLEVISDSEDEITKYILNESGHSCTILKGTGAYSHLPKNVIHIVISVRQVREISNRIMLIDKNAFIIEYAVSRTYGKFYLPPFK